MFSILAGQDASYKATSHSPKSTTFCSNREIDWHNVFVGNSSIEELKTKLIVKVSAAILEAYFTTLKQGYFWLMKFSTKNFTTPVFDVVGRRFELLVCYKLKKFLSEMNKVALVNCWNAQT